MCWRLGYDVGLCGLTGEGLSDAHFDSLWNAMIDGGAWQGSVWEFGEASGWGSASVETAYKALMLWH